MTSSDEVPVTAHVGPHETTTMPIMQGNARMARGADPYFEVPLFSRLTRFLWMGCSPSEFPDEMEQYDYDFKRAYSVRLRIEEPVNCHWLYMGEHNAGEDTLVPRFDAILNLYPWGEYKVPDGVDYRAVEMYDSEGLPDKDQVDTLAAWVIERRALGDTGRVLVHCQAGLNRSSLISARVLMLAKAMSAEDAIAHIRQRRSPMCLCNEDFETFLRSL